MNTEKKILQYIRMNPYISQQEIARNVGLSRSAVAGYITNLIKRGEIVGRAYILREDSLIVCIGGANIDRKAHGKQKLSLYSSNPVTITEFSGGVARNVAENLSRLNLKTALITCVGNDKEGDWLLEEAKNLGIDVSHVWRLPDERTGTYTALLDSDGEMLISTADMELYDKMTPSMFEDKWSYITSSRAVFMDTNIPADSIRYVINRCQAEGLPLYIDPVSVAKAQKLPHRLEGVELILPNQDEAEALADMKIEGTKDCEQACQRIRQRGVEKVIITLGSHGAYYAEEEHSGHLPSIKTNVVDVTGAGDAFTASVIYGLTEGKSFTHAVQLGQCAAALTLQDDKTVSPLLSDEKLYEMIKEIS